MVVDLSRNWGHMGAISAGLQTARGEAVVLMDGDFQDPPEVLPELVDAWRGGAQVVIAVRKSRKERRKVLAKLFPLFYRTLAALSDYPIPLDAGIFSLLDRKAVDSINNMRESNRYLPGLRAWVGYSNAVVFYDRHDRLAGDGKLSFISRIKYAMDAITSFSYKPLRLCFVMSCFSYFMVAVLALFSLFSKSPLNSIGFGVAAAVVLFVGGMAVVQVFRRPWRISGTRVRRGAKPAAFDHQPRFYSAADAISVQASLEYEEEERARVPEAQVAWDLKYPVATPEQETVRFPAPQEA